MTQPRIDSMTVQFRRGSPPRRPKAGDEKMIRGVLHVRQQEMYSGMHVVSNGKPVWEWVVRGSERDRYAAKPGQKKGWGRYRSLRSGKDVPEPPAGWKIIEAGRPVPKEYLVFVEGYRAADYTGWRKGEPFHGFEATYEGERRAFAIPKTPAEMTRTYFEDGCECIGKLFKKRGPSIGAERAVKFYMSRCKCRRHPEYRHDPQ